MKKIAMLFIVFAAVLLAGCATTMDANNAASSKDSVAPINRDMNSEDQTKLLKLIGSAKENATESWSGYEFTSLKVYVNSQGEACRRYKLKTTSWISGQEVTQTACRDSKGVWQIQ